MNDLEDIQAKRLALIQKLTNIKADFERARVSSTNFDAKSLRDTKKSSESYFELKFKLDRKLTDLTREYLNRLDGGIWGPRDIRLHKW